MNFGLCHACGSDQSIVFCDGHCSRAFCEKCIDAALGAPLHDLYTDSDVDLVCYYCERGMYLCWICGMPTRRYCMFYIYVCQNCERKNDLSEACQVCHYTGHVVTCYYCLKSYHEVCDQNVLRLDEYSKITAGVCASCKLKTGVQGQKDFRGVGINKADLHPYQGLLAQRGKFKKLMDHLQDQIFAVPFCREYQELIGRLCSRRANYELLDSIPDILNTLPLRNYNLDIIKWLMLTIEACMRALRDQRYAYEVVQETLSIYKKDKVGFVIRMLAGTIQNQIE